jgi:heme/copper-type cytochrome/quinol oxidase subunit 2
MQVRIPREFSLITYSLLPDKPSLQPFLLICAVLLTACTNKPSGPVQHVRVTMRRFAIEPAVIHVKQGANVVLDVSTQDVQHGFQMPELGINEPIQPGRPAQIPLDTSRKGQFNVACSIICGPGHDDMQAEVVVE